jgi:hypothetical protein
MMDNLLSDRRIGRTASWFVTDVHGTQVAAAFDDLNVANTVGQNYCWRTYFHGGADDLVRKTEVGTRVVVRYNVPPSEQHITEVHLSAPFQSKASNKWKVAVSAPIYRQKKFIGVVALTVDIGVFIRFEEGSNHLFAVLVDTRGANAGMVMQHPLFDKVLQSNERLPDAFSTVRVRLQQQFENDSSRHYEDPLAEDKLGVAYRKRWIAAMAPVQLEKTNAEESELTLVDTGLRVIVQEDYEEATRPVRDLGVRLLREAAIALAVVVVVIVLMWAIVVRAMREGHLNVQAGARRMEPTPVHDRSTVAAPRRH